MWSRNWLVVGGICLVMMTGCDESKDGTKKSEASTVNTVAAATPAVPPSVQIGVEKDPVEQQSTARIVSVTVEGEEPVDIEVREADGGTYLTLVGFTKDRDSRATPGTLCSLKKGEQVEAIPVGLIQRWRERRYERLARILGKSDSRNPFGPEGGVEYGMSMYYKGWAPGVNMLPQCMTFAPQMNPQPPMASGPAGYPSPMPPAPHHGTAVAPASGNARPNTPVSIRAERGPAAQARK